MQKVCHLPVEAVRVLAASAEEGKTRPASPLSDDWFPQTTAASSSCSLASHASLPPLFRALQLLQAMDGSICSWNWTCFHMLPSGVLPSSWIGSMGIPIDQTLSYLIDEVLLSYGTSPSMRKTDERVDPTDVNQESQEFLPPDVRFSGDSVVGTELVIVVDATHVLDVV